MKTKPTATAPDELLTTGQVAERINRSQETVRYFRHVGRGPRSFRIGRRVMYRAADVESWLHELYAAGGNGQWPVEAGDPGRPAA